MFFAQCLKLQQEASHLMKGVKDPNKAKDIILDSYSNLLDMEKWEAYGITNEKFVNLTVEFTKVLSLQVIAENAMSELKVRIYEILPKEMNVYLKNLSSCYQDYMKKRDRWGEENTTGVLNEVDMISEQFMPYILNFKKAVLGQAVYQKIKHVDLMTNAIFAEKLAAVACQYTADLLNNKLYDYPDSVKTLCRNIDFYNMAKILKTIRRQLEAYCGHVSLSHAIKMNVALKTLTTKIDNIKRDENGKYITI